MSELVTLEVLVKRVQALEARIEIELAPMAGGWAASDGLFDQSDEAVSFRRGMDEEVQKARAADRAELGLDAPHVAPDEPTA